VRHTAHPAYSGRSALLVFAGYPIANRIRRRGHARCPYACEDQKAATGIHKFPLHSFIPEKVAESPAELEPAPARDGSSRPGGIPLNLPEWASAQYLALGAAPAFLQAPERHIAVFYRL
jgi:hypothetical protein